MKVLKYILLVIVLLGSEQITLSQYYLKAKSDSISLESDSVSLFIDGYRETINWQASSDLKNWISLNKHKDTLGVRIDSSAYYRATIIEGNCNPVKSDTAYLIEKLTITNSNLFTVDNLGGVFLLPSGIKVKIPAGAVSGPKETKVDLLRYDDANALSTIIISENTAFLSGFSITTDQFDFKKPIKIKIPLQNIDENGLAFLYELNYENNTWVFSDKTMIVDFQDKFIEIIVKESAKKAATGTENYIVKSHNVDIESEDPCRSKRYKSETSDNDFVNAQGCVVSQTKNQIIYYDCASPQSESYEATEIAPSCVPKLIFSPNSLKIQKDKEGKPINITTQIGGLPLAKQIIDVIKSDNLSFTSPDTPPETDFNGQTVINVKGENIGPGTIYLFVEFDYYLTTIKVSGAGESENNPINHIETPSGLQIINVTVFDMPEVGTISVADIKCTSATIYGAVISDNYDEVTERGVCWGKNQNPDEITGTKVKSDSGEDDFPTFLKDLHCNTTYYVRAYAKNSAGISYGKQIEFTTIKPKVEIMGPKEIHTLEAITFTAKLTNCLNQPIDGNISWKAIPIGVPYVGGFDDNTSTFYARREGEVAIVALAKQIDNCNSSDDITDTVRVKVTADCVNKPLQPDCHSTWEGTVQIKAELFQGCYSNSMFVCNNYCRSRYFFTYNLTLTLKFEINATDSRNVGKLYVTGTETLDGINWDNWNQTCASFSQTQPIDETDNLFIPNDIYNVDPITHFLSSYNDFGSSFGGYYSGFTTPWPFYIVGTINGNSGNLTITSYNVIDNGGGVDVTETPVKTEIVLTKISK